MRTHYLNEKIQMQIFSNFKIPKKNLEKIKFFVY